MGESVYVDLFVLINFSMDFLCFFLTANLLNRPFVITRALLSSIVGGIYADLALFFSAGKLLSFVIDLGVCSLLCAIAFGQRRKAKELPLFLLVYLAVSMALGGIMTALFQLLNRSSILENVEMSEGDGISVWTFFLLALLSGIITFLSGRFFRKKTAKAEATVEIFYEGKQASLSAMSDSGNLLREPLSGKPCIVADIHAMEQVLPREIILAARANAVSLEKIPVQHAKRVRLVPTKTAAGQGMLLAIRAERIAVDCGKGAHEIDALIALADLGKSADGNEALLPSVLLV